MGSFDGLRELLASRRRMNEWERAQPRRYMSFDEALEWIHQVLSTTRGPKPPLKRNPENTARHLRRQREKLARLSR